MKKLMEQIQENVNGNYSKTYMTPAAALKAVENYELKFDMSIDALVVPVEVKGVAGFKFAVAIYGNRSFFNDERQRGHEISTLCHGTKGMLVFN